MLKLGSIRDQGLELHLFAVVRTARRQAFFQSVPPPEVVARVANGHRAAVVATPVSAPPSQGFKVDWDRAAGTMPSSASTWCGLPFPAREYGPA